jgi:hypothetical protein
MRGPEPTIGSCRGPRSLERRGPSKFNVRITPCGLTAGLSPIVLAGDPHEYIFTHIRAL